MVSELLPLLRLQVILGPCWPIHQTRLLILHLLWPNLLPNLVLLLEANMTFFKAPLVGDGQTQRVDVDYGETFSPVMKPATIHMVLSLGIRDLLTLLPLLVLFKASVITLYLSTVRAIVCSTC